MERSDEALIDRFPIGPATALGRAIALRVLFCTSARNLLRICWWRGRMAAKKARLSMDRVARTLARILRLRQRQFAVAFALAVALFLRQKSQTLRAKLQHARRRYFWKTVMKNACTYEEWAHAAAMLEKESPPRKDSDLFDEDLVSAKLTELRRRREEGGVQDILFCLRTDLLRNLGNMCNPDLHKGRLQMPTLIQQYIDEVRYHLRAVTDSQSEDLPLEEKLAFIHETRHAFGRTALLLSGGSTLGAFHLGVAKTLIEHHLLPRVIAGASVGSIICSAIGTRTWPELQSFFGADMPSLEFFDQSGGVFAILNRIFTKGVLHEIRRLQYLLRKYTYNLTFQEAYDITGRVLGVSVCSPRRHEPPRCLNYLTSPHVVIWSAVTASCAFPGLFEAQELMAKDRHGRLVPYHTPVEVGPEEQAIGARYWRDGSLESDLPMLQLKELFNVNHFIVSQANPHVAPILRIKDIIRAYGGDSAAKLAHLVEMEVKHRCHQILEMGFPIGGLAKVVAQDWEGDITIVMPATVAQLAKLIQNPTPSDLKRAINQGRRCTWEKLSAIKANCGIELMLDQCVSVLNQLRRIKRSLERNSVQLTALTVPPVLGAKRIPSWNCLERESSWGSLDEDGVAEISLTAGGPWAGPSLGTMKPLFNSYNGSDSETENESVNFSWTRAGGPLMRTASATKFMQDYGGESDGHLNREELPAQDSLDDAASAKSPCASMLQDRELMSSERESRIWERSTVAITPDMNCQKLYDGDKNYASLSLATAAVGDSQHESDRGA